MIKFSQTSIAIIPKETIMVDEVETIVPEKIVFCGTSTDGFLYYKIGIEGEWVLLDNPIE